jgi:uncharacterized RmlC-like cupin family protein
VRSSSSATQPPVRTRLTATDRIPIASAHLPPANGLRFAIIDLSPNTAATMHRTETLDYIIVVSEEIEMDMDESTVKLRAGDVMVQRGADHTWKNRSNAPARVAFVLIDVAPFFVRAWVPWQLDLRDSATRTDLHRTSYRT